MDDAGPPWCSASAPAASPAGRTPAAPNSGQSGARVQHQHGPFGGAEAVKPEAIGTAAIAEVGEIRLGAGRRHVFMVARRRAHPRLEPAEARLETVAEVLLRAARIGQVAREDDVAIEAIEQPRNRRQRGGAAPPRVAQDVDEVDALPGAGITGGVTGTRPAVGGRRSAWRSGQVLRPWSRAQSASCLRRSA